MDPHFKNRCNVTVPEYRGCNYFTKDVTYLDNEETNIEKKKYKKVTYGDAFVNIHEYEADL